MNNVSPKKRRFVISKNNLISVISICILVSATFIMHYNIKIITYLYFPFEMISILLLWKGRNVNNFIYILFICLLELVVVIPTVFNDRVTYSYLCLLVSEVFLTWYVVKEIKIRPDNLIELFQKSFFALFILDVITIVICLITGEHSNDNFGLVGHKNYHSFLFVLTLGFCLMSNKIKGKKIINMKVIVITILSVLLELAIDSASGFVAIALLVILCFFMSKRNLRIINFTTIMIGLLIINYIVVYAITQFPIVQKLLVMMGRDAGLSGRAQMWDKALKLISIHPFYGYGFLQSITIWSIGESDWVNNNCHNFFLNLILSGGIIYTLIIIGFMFIIGKRIRNNENELMNIFTYMLGCYFLLGISEVIVNVTPMFFPLLTIGYYAQHLSAFLGEVGRNVEKET